MASKNDQVFCRECGKPIEADARFCRFCGKAQAEPTGVTAASSTTSRSAQPTSQAADGLENWLRKLFPRHHLQDEFAHIGTIAAFFMALIGFLLGFFTPALGENWLSTNFLLAAVALLLFLILRESTLSHIRGRGSDTVRTADGDRYRAARRGAGPDLPAEAATTQSSPPGPRPSAPSSPASSGRPPSRQ